MRIEFDYIAEGDPYRAVAKDADRFFGKGVRVTIFETSGKTRNQMSFVCHPEFHGYDEMQGKSSKELAMIAIERLNAGEFVESLKEVRGLGMELLFRFNQGEYRFNQGQAKLPDA